MIGEEEFGNTLNFSGSQKCKFSFLLLGEKKELYECYDLMMLLVIHSVGVLLRRTCPVLNRNSDDVGKSVWNVAGLGNLHLDPLRDLCYCWACALFW